MSGFNDPEAARRAIARIDATTHRDSGRFVAAACEAASHPDQALINLERWLKATGSPATLYDSLTAPPEVGGLLVALLGASSQMADVLTQNPEMANLVLDPEVLQQRPDREALLSHARKLLAESSSYTHSLDRLRFMKQSWSLRIAAADLGGLWPEEDVWLGLSVVADVLVSCARDVVWLEMCSRLGSTVECPVSIVAMGKLGGRELNFSSDIDLIYVLDDGADEQAEKRAVRFCEALSRALSDRMGRGSLYRVDLRLRPYGSRGALAPAMAAVEGYYERYAEPWEHLAMVRSRVIAGSDKVAERWGRLRTKTVFHETRGEWVVADLIAMRARQESRADERDLKAGRGGIRDVEFLVQIMQMLYGHGRAELRTFATCDALRALGDEGVIEPRTAQELLSGYTFLRQVEHRAQLLGDRQTHSLPKSWEDREYLGRRMGFASLPSFDAAVTLHRMQIRNAYDAVLRPQKAGEGSAREETARRLGDDAPLVTAWIDSTPAPEPFYESLVENESSLDRVRSLALRAPALVPPMREYVAVTEQVLSGEILEPYDPGERFPGVDRNTSPEVLAAVVRRGWLRVAARWALSPNFDYGERAAALADAALRTVLHRCDTQFEVVALGSYAAGEMSLFSDLDVIFVQSADAPDDQAEKTARDVLAAAHELKQAGSPLELDMRLRPEGRLGRLVVSHEGLRAYGDGAMEPWERMAFGRARAVYGEGACMPVVAELAFGRELDGRMVDRLAHIKRRVETERVPAQHRDRHVKLGRGGQDDVLWLVQLLWWRHRDRLGENHALSVSQRLSALAGSQILEGDDATLLQDAWRFLSSLRLHLGLLGLSDEVLPEDPDTLGRLGLLSGIGGATEVMASYRRHSSAVRGIYERTLERLGD